MAINARQEKEGVKSNKQMKNRKWKRRCMGSEIYKENIIFKQEQSSELMCQCSAALNSTVEGLI